MRLLAAVFVFFTITAAAQAAEPVVPLSPEAQKALLASKDPQLAANKKLVWDMWRTFLQGGDIDAADKYLAPEYHQLNLAQREYIDELAGPLRAASSTPDLIDRGAVWEAKRLALELIYSVGLTPERKERYRRFADGYSARA